ncbi:signal peptide peptidase SppA [Congregibacter litoralis]|uniref:Signal peptide peptidase SppA, 67K type n=1 Tax=Congregibacter litoralis KT71 TaxID=314285 RepID=A4ACK1_9GAMM|nr:signal peptide peptidase SppA [Congregibacter litoralis]EAQ96215.2 signal peptide peptidase SppA, 67K type [Congregibacter litoralis KT71]
MIKRIFLALWRGLTILRLALANLIFIVLLVVLWMSFSGSPEPLPQRAALVLDPTGRVVDERSQIEAASLLFEQPAASRETLLTDLIDSVELARSDDRIAALVLKLGGLVSIGQSKTTELAEAIARFRETGKPVIAVGDYFTQDQYRLAVEADTLLMHPFGAVALEGFSFYTNYFADALDKLSVTMHVFRAGDYKSIAEPLLRNDMSPGERQITREWLDDLWDAYSSAVESRRGLEPGAVNALLNDFPARLRAVDGDGARLALEAGLVDELLDRSQQNSHLVSLVGATDEDGSFQGVSFSRYVTRMRPSRAASDLPKVAVVTAQGNMLPGDQPPGTIGSGSLSRLLRKTAERKGVEAIVLRVTTGGGSVFASEIIRAEIERIRKTGMPVVVSMGSVAASGGYYIATAADRIFATPTSLTGSIGVFAAFPTVERLLAKGGVQTDGLGTTELAGALRPDRALNPALADTLQQSVDHIYRQFLGLVSESRSIDLVTLDALAQGRVLSARDALEAGLIDGLGSLDDAAKEAAALAGLDDDYAVISILPEFSSSELLLQQLSDRMGAGRLMTMPGLASGLSALLEPVRRSVDMVDSFADPGHLYMRCFSCDL